MGQANNRRFFIIAAGLALASATLLVPSSVPAQHPVPSQSRAEQPSHPAAQDLLERLAIPQELGHISEIRPAPNAAPSTKTLLIIQDAHVNYEAQKHLAQILDQLASTHGLRLILVEGGEGDVSVSYLRQRGPHAVRQEVAEDYLKRGLLSGEEYLDIVSDHPLILWGVDDLALYDQALSVFLEVEQMRSGMQQQLAQLREAVKACRATLPNEPLRIFEDTRTAFAREELSVSDYADALWKAAFRAQVPTAGYPTLQRLLDVKTLEGAVDHAQVEAEQRQAVIWLREHGARDEVSRLLELGRQVKAGQAAPEAFYQRLETLLQGAGSERARWAQLSNYIRYVTLKAQLPSKTLWLELRALEAKLQLALVASETETELLAMAEAVDHGQRLLALQWTPDDYQASRAHQQDSSLTRWVPRLETLAGQLGVAWRWQGDPAALDLHLARAAAFYEIASAREAGIIQRALEKMDAEGQSTAVLIVGGFHTERLSQALADRGVQVAVITPLVGREEDDRRYPAILKAKYQDRRANTTPHVR